MKLYATDQISISAVQSDSLRPGQPFEVSDDYGKELLAKVPHAVSTEAPKVKAEPAPKNKAEPKPKNKAK
ncbi:MAG TPA: hypothetical protein VL147_01770 [Devosia sp.]|nr:hypothetical protein [Devosia sp.]